jgi:hypothetical protein
MFTFADMLDLLANEFSGLRRRSLALARIPSSPVDRLFSGI